MEKSLFIFSFLFLSVASSVYGQSSYSGGSGMIGEIIIGIIIFLGVLFLIREIVCWYSKINKRIEIQEELLGTMKRILEEIRKDNKPVEINFKPIEIKSEERLKD
jgi:NhaP-type Na+/H+ or K+/H+ antiporter